MLGDLVDFQLCFFEVILANMNCTQNFTVIYFYLYWSYISYFKGAISAVVSHFLFFPLFSSEFFRYYEGLQKCLGLYSENAEYSSSEIEQLEALYKSLGLQYTWSSAVKV